LHAADEDAERGHGEDVRYGSEGKRGGLGAITKEVLFGCLATTIGAVFGMGYLIFEL